VASVTREKFKEGYDKVFNQQWPLWLGGVLIGLLSILVFVWSRPWGVFGGIKVWGDWVFHSLGLYKKAGLDPVTSSSSILSFGLIAGACGAALMSRQFSVRKTPGIEIVKGLVGGSFMGVGASLASGCNVGGFYVATSALSFSGPAMMVGLIIGAFVGLKYLLWEMEKFPPKQTAAPVTAAKEGGVDWKKIQPWIGVLVFIGGIVAAVVYARYAYAAIGGLLLFGMAFGLVIQRSRFCFVRGFRDPFMTGEGEASRAIAVSLIISVIGLTIVKYVGLRPEDAYVPAKFWIGGLAGGIVFGMGMVVAGGCGSGTLWRVGEGHVKLWCALLTFALVGSLWSKFMDVSGLVSYIGKSVYMPNVMGYVWSLVFVVLLMAVYFWIATWNEETDKFTVF
jgi:uncharacterized protein